MNQQTKASAKQTFIGEYLDKHMKGHALPYGMAYLNLLAETELKAEKAWKIKHSKLINDIGL